MVERITEKIATFQSKGSGWRLYSIIRLELHTVRYKPLKGKSYIPLPEELANKKAIINMKNSDNQCFLWCILRALNPRDRDQERVDTELKKKKNTLTMKGIEYPVSLKDLGKFEKQNRNISIMILGYEEKGVYPLRISDCVGRDYKIILLLIEEGGVKHYCLIKNLSRLLSSQVSNHKDRHYLCLRSLNPFWCQESLSRHQEYCNEYEAVKRELPEKGTMLKYEHYYKSEKVPFIIYADFESYIKPMHSCDPNPEGSYTKQYQKHEPSSFCYYIKCFSDEVFEPKLVTYTGKNAAQKFVDMLEKDFKEITNIEKKDIIFGEKERRQFMMATKCWICNIEFDKYDVKVKDHCHFTGRFRGAAHKICNLKYRIPYYTSVVFHNLSVFSEGSIECIPNSEERYTLKNTSWKLYEKNIKRERS